MKIESSARIEAPPLVVYRFYVRLDHLRYVSAGRRSEWCPEGGLVLVAGGEYTVRVEQGGHRIDLRFRTRRLDANSRCELEFVSWPLRGAVHVQTFESLDGDTATLVRDVDEWRPPWYLRRVVDRMLDGQRALFEEKLQNAKQMIERVYGVLGEQAFARSIDEDMRLVGIEPVVSD